MTDSRVEFSRRLQQLDRKHRALARGYVAQMRPDGLIVMQPRYVAPRIQLRAVAMFFLGFVLFKAFLIADIGRTGYDERVSGLRLGTSVEQAGAWLMQADPVSIWAAQQIGPYLR